MRKGNKEQEKEVPCEVSPGEGTGAREWTAADPVKCAAAAPNYYLTILAIYVKICHCSKEYLLAKFSLSKGKNVNINIVPGAFIPACFRAWRVAVLFAVLSTSSAVLAQSIARPASGSAPGGGRAVPMVATGSSLTSDQSLTYTFPQPVLTRGSDGLYDITMPGLDNYGDTGAPLLPYLPVRIALPQGRAIKAVNVSGEDFTVLQRGITIRHASRPTPMSAPVPTEPTPRNEKIYSLSGSYPAKPESDGVVAWKNGVGFYQTTLIPVVYRPESGEVGYYKTIQVEVVLDRQGSSATRGGAAAQVQEDISTRTPFQSQERASALLPLLDNPDVVSGYKAVNAVADAAVLDGDDAGLAEKYVKPVLPCVPTNRFTHVIITTESLSPAFQALMRYRRSGGTRSTVVTVEDISRAYRGVDAQDRIRKFITDAYFTWKTDYVVLGGDSEQVPPRMLWVEAWRGGDATSMPSDLYYQCLDGNFDANGNGIYGEPDDDVDLFSEIAIGRVSAETADEVLLWLGKVMQYDADCLAKADYTRAAAFLGEYAGPLPNCYGKPSMELIRYGTKYNGNNGGFRTAGFADAPHLFDDEKTKTLYDKDEEWDTADVVSLINSDSVSVINHLGHSSPQSNMRISIEQADALANKSPLFAYSQGCEVGYFDKDCIAEHFTTSTGSGFFAGVWNARYGWYSYSQSGISQTGGSQRFHRWFWNSVFADELTELGRANAMSHERNAALINGDCMRWCYYETNLFGDPIQSLCGPSSSLEFDRDAYRPDADALITYKASGIAVDEVEAVLSLVPSNTADSVFLCNVTLYRGAEDSDTGVSAFTNTVALSALSGEYKNTILRPAHGDKIYVELSNGTRWDIADIDSVPPQILSVSLINPDEGMVLGTWETDELTDSSFTLGTSVPLPADSTSVVENEYARKHSAIVEGLAPGMYYARIVVADKAGNTNAVPVDAACAVGEEYPRVIVASRRLRASYDLENDASGWKVDPPTSATYTNCWELGMPTYGPENASRCFGTVLGGRYLSGANDSIVSPPVSLANCPTISFRHWYDVEKTPLGAGNDYQSDYGTVEAMVVGSGDPFAGDSAVDGAWHDVMKYARVERPSLVQGDSGNAWESVRILLPEEYYGKTVRLRFRFVSDTYSAARANPAGWYVDTVTFEDVPEEGVTLVVSEIDDSAANGDGLLQPGEKVKVALATANISFEDMVVPAGKGKVILSAAGDATGKVRITGSSPAPVSYPVLKAGVPTLAEERLEIEVDEDVPYGTKITLTQTIEDQNGKVYIASAVLSVTAPGSVKGRVMQPTGNPVCNAKVLVNTSDGDYRAVTDDTGSFSIDGILEGRTLRAYAAYGEAVVSKIVTTPDPDVEFILPLAEIGLSEEEFVAEAEIDDDPMPFSFAITNFFTLAAADGNIGPSDDLRYKVSGFTDEYGLPLDWITIVSETEGVIPPQGESLFEFTLNPRALPNGGRQTVSLIIESNAWNDSVKTVEIDFSVIAYPELVPDGIVATDDLNGFDIPVDEYENPLFPSRNDFDGFLECDELGPVWFVLKNTGKVTVGSVVGEVTVVSGNANIVMNPPAVNYPGGEVLKWENIHPTQSAKSVAPALVQWFGAPGDIVTFLVYATVAYEGGSEDVVYTFDVVTPVRDTVSGLFEKENLFPALPEGEKSPVNLAIVTATSASGEVITSTPTDKDGNYELLGLVPGEYYWISFLLDPADTETVAPPPFLLSADKIDGTEDDGNFANGEDGLCPILGTTYGANTAHFVLDQVEYTTTDGDAFAEPGEEIIFNLSVLNNGAVSGKNLSFELTAPEFERSGCMDVTVPSVAAEGIAEVGVSFACRGLAAKVRDSAVTGDFQRFILTVTEGDEESGNAKKWYFDFVVQVASSANLSGTVRTEDGSLFETALVTLEGTGLSQTVLDSGNGSGTYVFASIEPGDYTVTVSGAPSGYYCKNPSVTVTIAEGADVTADFLFEKWAVDAADSEYYDPETGRMEIEIDEGESLEVPFTVNNGTAQDRDFEVAIRFVRKPSDILDREQLEKEVSLARYSTLARAGADWTKLDRNVFNPNQLEVLFKEGTPVEARDAYLARFGFKASYHFKSFPGSIAVPADSSLASYSLSAPAAFTADGEDSPVVSVMPSIVTHELYTAPDDPLYPQQWALDNIRQTGGTKGADIGAEAAWKFAGTMGSSDIRIAITDTGIDYRHPDLAVNVVGGWNYVYDTPLYNDEHGHGTHCAGISGAVGNNGIGVCGVNADVGIIASRICAKDPMTGGDVWATSAMIARAFEESFLFFGCSVNNNSWGGPLYSEFIYQAMKAGRDHDMLFIVSAGNEGLNNGVVDVYPANYARMLDNVIVVAAADHDDNIAEFSNYSPELVHLAAPGVDILSTYIDTGRGAEGENIAAEASYGNYAILSGTSMASPYVAGAAAYLKSVSPASSYAVIRDALLNGVRRDPDLADKTQTSGHLDLATSVRLLGRTWLRFANEGDDSLVVTNISVAAGASADLTLLVNDPARLLTGEYEASVTISDDTASRDIEVLLTVNPAAAVTVKSVEVTGEEWPDGRPECGEAAGLSIVLENIGSSEFDDLTATLTTNGTDIASFHYGYLAGIHSSEAGLFQVVFPEGVTSAEYVLVVRDGDKVVAELPVSIPLFNGTVLKVVAVDGGVPVAGAVAELTGGAAATSFTDAEGVAYLPVPAGASTVTLRVIADGCVRYTAENAPVSGETTAELGHAALEIEENVINLTVTEGKSLVTNFTISSVEALSASLKVAPRSKIAVFDDRDDSALLVSSLRAMGFEVDYYPDNFKIVTVTSGPSLSGSIIHTVVHSWDDALVTRYDAVVSVLSGTDGSGRLLGQSEAKAFAGFVNRGGRIVFTGTSPLSRPDNGELAEILGLPAEACDNIPVDETASAYLGFGFTEQPFAKLADGALFPADPGLYDAMLGEYGGSAVATVTGADTETVTKIFASARSEAGGIAVIWDGNASEFAHEGAALDILRDFFYNELIKDASVSWLTLGGGAFDLQGSTNLAFTVNESLSLGVGEYSAVALVLAEVDGEECIPVTVNLKVEPPVIRVYNNLDAAVVDFGGRPLVGNGGPDSSFFQLIWAGPDGIADPPAEDGTATGDDVILSAAGTGNSFAFFGCGENVLPDSGRFDAEFNLSFASYDASVTNMLYIRAFDAPSAASATAYGDSELRQVIYADGAAEAIDFGSWTVGTPFCDAFTDSDGDTIPDAWIIGFRPDLDPRTPVEPLDTVVSNGENDYFETAAAPQNYNADGNPARVFVAGDYVYVLEQWTHRIVVRQRTAPYAVVATYGKNGGDGSFGSGEGEFNRPFGMALDTFTTGAARLAVADTGNNRVQLFSFDGTNITFVSSYGVRTVGDNGPSVDTSMLAEPCAVAFVKGGDLLVADTGNFRVIRLRTTGGVLSYNTKYDFDNRSSLRGICYDKDSLEGFWVADAGAGMQRISFHHTAKFSKDPVVSFGAYGAGLLTSPRDVQVWTIGGRKRICAVDYSGSRVRVLDCQSNAKGAYTNVVFAADIGSYTDTSLQPYQKLWLPNGVFPVNGTNLVYVADYGHNRIKWYGLSMDADGDGMDDFWEDMNGLDSTRNDAMEDADGDGLANVGEFRAGTDPNEKDSDGDGVGDLTEMLNLRDPLDPEEPMELNEVTSVASFDAAGVSTNEFEIGSVITVKAFFERNISGKVRIALYNGAGDCVVDTEAAVSNLEATVSYTAVEGDAGLFEVRVKSAECDPPVCTASDLFTVLGGGSEEETTGPEAWAITSITLDDTGAPSAVITWDFPAGSIPASGICTFQVEFTTELGAGWDAQVIPPVDAANAAECRAVVPFADLGNPAKCFFRLVWTNKVIVTE